jgi:hypothetical protein
MDGSANVVGIIKAAWKYRASLAPVAAQQKNIFSQITDTRDYIQCSEYRAKDAAVVENPFNSYVAGYEAMKETALAHIDVLLQDIGDAAPVSAQQGAAEAKRTIDTEAFRSVLGAYVGALEAQETRRKIEDHYRSIVLFVDSQLSAAKAPAAQTVDARDIDNLDLPDFWKLVRKYANAGGDTRITAGQALLDHIEQWHDSSDNQPNASIVAQDAAALAWQHALESAAFYVAGHCANGDHHAKIIMMMPAPTITINVDAARRFRAQGGIANDSSANLAATTAGAAATDQKKQVLLDEAAKFEKVFALGDLLDVAYIADSLRVSAGEQPKHEALYAAKGAATTSEDARDAARLDWLMQNNSDLSLKIKGIEGFGWFVHDPISDTSGPYFETPREAIDSAMRATQQEGGK